MATKKTVTTEPVQEDVAVKATTAPDPKADWVQIFLHKDNNEYRFDLPVIINGKTWMIKRGEPVMVPPEVAEVIFHAQQADAEAVRTVEYYKQKPTVVDQM